MAGVRLAAECRSRTSTTTMKLNLLNSLTTEATGVALIALVAVAGCGNAQDKITKSFKVQPGGQLVVQADRGSIEITTAGAESVDIEVVRKAGGSQAQGEQILKDHVITMTQTGNKVDVKAEYKGGKMTGWFRSGPDLQVKYPISIPRKFDVDLKTSGGSIKVAELTGKVQAQTSGGSLNS